MNTDNDHRVMWLTPPGAGAIGIVRIVGPRAADLVRRIFRSRSSNPPAWDETGSLAHGLIMEGDDVLDDVLVGTVEVDGVRAVDICAHGGVRVMERLVMLLEREGATLLDREAVPSDVWPGRNVIEREADDALGGALTERAVRFVAYQRAHFAGAVEEIAADPRGGIERLREMLRFGEGARLLIEGATVAIVGPPNSGKSTLVNRLAGRQVAVSSDRAGTTRDWVSVAVEMCGVPVTLVDTAGRAGTPGPLTDVLECEAVELGRGVSDAADVRVVLLDGSVELDSQTRRFLAAAADDPRCVVTLNKRDLAPIGDPPRGEMPEAAWISAEDGTGVDGLVRRVAMVLAGDPEATVRPTAFTDRQVRVIQSVISDPSGGPEHVAARLRGELLGIAR